MMEIKHLHSPPSGLLLCLYLQEGIVSLEFTWLESDVFKDGKD